MKRVMVITPPDAEHGFGLAGVSQRTAGAEEASTVLRKAAADPDNGLIVLDERLARAIGEDALKQVERNWPGVVVVLPLPARLPREGDDYAMRLIRRAIGYHVRLRL